MFGKPGSLFSKHVLSGVGGGAFSNLRGLWIDSGLLVEWVLGFASLFCFQVDPLLKLGRAWVESGSMLAGL
jgi:hypothetical protein